MHINASKSINSRTTKNLNNNMPGRVIPKAALLLNTGVLYSYNIHVFTYYIYVYVKNQHIYFHLAASAMLRNVDSVYMLFMLVGRPMGFRIP